MRSDGPPRHESQRSSIATPKPINSWRVHYETVDLERGGYPQLFLYPVLHRRPLEKCPTGIKGFGEITGDGLPKMELVCLAEAPVRGDRIEP